MDLCLNKQVFTYMCTKVYSSKASTPHQVFWLLYKSVYYYLYQIELNGCAIQPVNLIKLVTLEHLTKSVKGYHISHNLNECSRSCYRCLCYHIPDGISFFYQYLYSRFQRIRRKFAPHGTTPLLSLLSVLCRSEVQLK